MQHYQMLIGGEWVDAADGRVFDTMNPYLGKPWATIQRAGRSPSRVATSCSAESWRLSWVGRLRSIMATSPPHPSVLPRTSDRSPRAR